MNNAMMKYIKKHNLDELIPLADFKETGINDSVNPDVVEPYQPEWPDLIRLHKLVIKRKVTTILEFGCGYSTLIFAHALAVNAEKHRDFVSAHLRRNNPFELHTLDDMPLYLEATKAKIPESLLNHVTLHFSPVAMCTFQDRIATEYTRLPNICPDLIYLDGPSQHSVQGDIYGITTAHPDRLPMACDLLKIEHFLLPGTLILVDGRTANARFLQANFQRNWIYFHDFNNDIHYFELHEPPLGKYNKNQISYCLERE